MSRYVLWQLTEQEFDTIAGLLIFFIILSTIFAFGGWWADWMTRRKEERGRGILHGPVRHKSDYTESELRTIAYDIEKGISGVQSGNSHRK